MSGDPFLGTEERKPLDYFTLQASGHISEEPYWSIYAYGLLLGKELGSKENQNHLIGLFQHYDFIYTEQIRLGGTSFCAGATSRFDLSQKVRLRLMGHLGWMMMGASQNDYVAPPRMPARRWIGITTTGRVTSPSWTRSSIFRNSAALSSAGPTTSSSRWKGRTGPAG